MARVLPPPIAIAVVVVLCLSACPADARSRSAEEAIDPARLGEPQTQLYRVGAVVTASGGPCADILAIVSLPLETPWQEVRLASEEFTPEVAAVDYRLLPGGGARQMMVSIPRLEGGAEARAVVTCEVTTHVLEPLETPATVGLMIPRRPPSAMRRFTGPSPMIEARSGKIKRLAKSIVADAAADRGDDLSDWRRVEAIYEHVLAEIDYAEGPDTSALTTLDEGIADCHGRSALFIALCRAIGVPARVVWVHDHCYPEFWLARENADGDLVGEWYPAESAGTPAFGAMPVARTILQRGDSFRVPERPRERLRYASDYLTGRRVPGGGTPKVRYLREVVLD